MKETQAKMERVKDWGRTAWEKIRTWSSRLKFTQASSILGDKTWRCEKYGPLGWLEILVKAMAIGVAVASLSIYTPDSRTYDSIKIAQIVFIGILASTCTFLILQRLVEREIFALIFIVLLSIGHWVLFAMLFQTVDPGAFVFTFCFLMIMGEYVKVMFLFIMNEYEVIWLPKPIHYILTFCLIIGYLTAMVLQIVIYLVDYST